MYIDLSGEWRISLISDEEQTGSILLPGILQSQGFGNAVSKHTPWVSSLHDDFWYEQEEFHFAQEDGVKVPFLAQPPAHFTGEAYYQREFYVEKESDEEWFFHVELTKWYSRVWIDDQEKGGCCSLCAPHIIRIGRLPAGKHRITVCVDNSMQFPYRPDSHSISDALGASWNGMVGEIALYTESENVQRREEKKRYAAEHMRTVEVRDGRFLIDGRPVYFRATHFGGEYPLTGYPVTDVGWWREKMQVMKEFGLNGIRFHSMCPPEAAFAAADAEDMYLLVECGMWNRFDEGIKGVQMREILREESRRIISAFGHHPSFVFFSSGNEPSGQWYRPLREWVSEIREYDKSLGYKDRRIYTAQSGWFYDTEPAKITGTDFLYFHRSAYGPLPGGVIRNHLGWKGKDYSPSLSECSLPVVSHELGQWCSYPDFTVIDKFTGYLQPGNYRIFRESARAAGLLELNSLMTRCSGENQMRLYKEDVEATLRTPQIQGFELLDLHDYLGQGTALVGLLDAFWEKKNYVHPDEFRQFCQETVLLARCSSYVWMNTEKAVIPLEVCHYGKEEILNAHIRWMLCDGEESFCEGILECPRISVGENTVLGNIELSFEHLNESKSCMLKVHLSDEKQSISVDNKWPMHVFVKQNEYIPENVLYTREWQKAKEALKEGARVVYAPGMTDLSYECPSLSIKNVFWNSQLGPTWCRCLGLIARERHPIFRSFPTACSGGWQWEDILQHARGFNLKGLENAEVLVRVIDDWNRNLPLGLIWEAKVGKGKLLVVSADLEGDFCERPAAYTLKNSILMYADSDEFCPEKKICPEEVEKMLFTDLRMQELAARVWFDEDTRIRDGEAVLQPNPNSFVRIEKERFPVNLTVQLKKKIEVQGILHVPVQRDRAHEGFVREYQIFCKNAEKDEWEQTAAGVLPNTCRSCQIPFERTFETDEIRFRILSAYGCVEKQVWENQDDGWNKVRKKKSAVVQIACLHVLCDEKYRSEDILFWEKDQKSNTKEIEA